MTEPYYQEEQETPAEYQFLRKFEDLPWYNRLGSFDFLNNLGFKEADNFDTDQVKQHWLSSYCENQDWYSEYSQEVNLFAEIHYLLAAGEWFFVTVNSPYGKPCETYWLYNKQGEAAKSFYSWKPDDLIKFAELKKILKA